MSKKNTTNIIKKIAIGIAVLVVFLGLVYLAIGAYAASEVTKPDKPENPSNKTPTTVGLEFEDVRILSREDGLKLAAWYIPSENATAAILLVHGRNTGKADAVSTHFVELAVPLHEAGLSVMMIDLRGHGESEGERYSFGVYERRDVLAAVDWLLDKGYQPGKIGILGISLGGGSVIGAVANESSVGAVALESTFADLRPLILQRFEVEAGLPLFLMPGVLIMNRVLYGFDLNAVRPVEEIVMIPPRPILIIHCQEDTDVPVDQAYQLAEAVDTEVHLMNDCEHAELYRDHPDEYEALIVPFFKESLE